MANFKAFNYADLQLGSTAASHSLPNWKTGIYAVLVDAGGDAPLQTDEDTADFTAGVVKQTTAALTCTITSGVVDITDFSFVSTTGNESEWVCFVGGATEASAPLMLAFDTATGLPVTPNGSDIDVIIHGSGILGEV